MSHPIFTNSWRSTGCKVGLQPQDAVIERPGVNAANSSSARRETVQIGSLLGFSRRGQALQFADTALEALIARAIQTVRVLPEFDGLAISWTCQPDCHAWLDAGKIERVVLNLLFNACAAVSPPDGAVHVECRNETDQVVLSVTDNGPGIPEMIRDHLFDPFVSADKEKGIGLGLTAAYMIVQEHGGAIDVERSGPHGTVFRVRLPTGGPAG